MKKGCLLCRIAGGEVEMKRLYEDELVVAFDIPQSYPWRQAAVHFLTISRERLPYVLPARSARFRQEATKC